MESEGTREAIEALAQQANDRLEELGSGVSSERLSLLVELGRARAALGAADADSALLEALDASAALGDRAAARTAAIELGSYLAKRGAPDDLVAARGHLERALEAAAHGRDALAAAHHALAAAELARALVASGERDAALALLARARGAAPPPVRARLELRTADAAALAGDRARARAAYARALDESRTLDARERAFVALEAGRGLEALASAPPALHELAALSARDLASLVLAGALIADSAPETRRSVGLRALLDLTGAASADLRAASAPGPTGDLELRRADRALTLTASPERPLGPREELMARALLSHLQVAEASTTHARVLAMLDRVLAAGLERDRLISVATAIAIEATGAVRGTVLLREPGTRHAFRVAIEDPGLVVSRTLAREVFISGKALVLADAASHPELGKAASVGSQTLRSVLVAPIPGEDPSEPAGALYLDDPGTASRFGSVERDVAVAFAARLGPPLRAAVAREREREAASSTVAALVHPGTRPRTRRAFQTIVGKSRAIGEVIRLLDRAVDATAPVLVSGESGTGKELVARALHAEGPRAAGPFQALSCGALSDSVLESELFGHVAGAFTGAVSARQGIFELAHGGTLFLDEVQDASPKLQAELLRVLETGEVRPIGANKVKRVDVRLVCATNADLRALIAGGTFREDLYYRVNVIQVRLPALRERVEDIPEIVASLLARAGARRELSPGVLERLLADPWHGNVRALKNCLDRALTLAGDGPILPEHMVLDPGPRPSSSPAGIDAAAAIELNARQLVAIDRLRSTLEVGTAEYMELTGVSQPTAWRDLNELVANGVLLKRGRGKATVYRLAPAWAARAIRP